MVYIEDYQLFSLPQILDIFSNFLKSGNV